MSPVVVNREQWERLQTVIYKNRTVSAKAKPPQRPPDPEPRYLFLRYFIGGRIRVKRLEVRNKASGNYCTDVIGDYSMSRVLKLRKKDTFILVLPQPENLERLLRRVLEYLKADPVKKLNYYWDDDVETSES